MTNSKNHPRSHHLKLNANVVVCTQKAILLIARFYTVSMSGFAMNDKMTGPDRIGPVFTDSRPVPVNFQ